MGALSVQLTCVRHSDDTPEEFGIGGAAASGHANPATTRASIDVAAKHIEEARHGDPGAWSPRRSRRVAERPARSVG